MNITLAKIEEFGRLLTPAESGCWEWQGSLNIGGYGQFYFNRKNHPAHRVSYELHIGPFPAGLVTDHLCRNRKCVNPTHLEAVSLKENTLRGISFSALNAKKTNCSMCGGPYSVNGRGYRFCRPCFNRKQVVYDARNYQKNKALKSSLEQQNPQDHHEN
jgi:hypothetical protein